MRCKLPVADRVTVAPAQARNGRRTIENVDLDHFDDIAQMLEGCQSPP